MMFNSFIKSNISAQYISIILTEAVCPIHERTVKDNGYHIDIHDKYKKVLESRFGVKGITGISSSILSETVTGVLVYSDDPDTPTILNYHDYSKGIDIIFLFAYKIRSASIPKLAVAIKRLDMFNMSPLIKLASASEDIENRLLNFDIESYKEALLTNERDIIKIYNDFLEVYKKNKDLNPYNLAELMEYEESDINNKFLKLMEDIMMEDILHIKESKDDEVHKSHSVN